MGANMTSTWNYGGKIIGNIARMHSLLNVMEKTSYGLGCTTIDRETAEINPFPICKRNTTSNTKGSQNIPYSRWL